MTVRRPAALAAFLLVAFLAAAQQPRVTHVRLLKVTRGDSTVYLLGSVHVARPDIYPLNEPIEEAFARSSRLVVEVDLARIDRTAFQKKVMSLGMLPAGRTLRTELPPEVSRKLEEKLSALGMPAAGFDRMRPWLVSMVLAELDFSRLGYDPANGVDLYFLSRAGEKEIVQLESADSQLEMLSGFSDEEQRELLAEYLNEPGIEEDAVALFDAWLSGDSELLSKLISGEMGGSAAGKGIEDALLRKRDAAMALKIEGLLEKPGTSFVVVGAAHLVGTGSVPDILGRDGYLVIDQD
jgi:uncharacterized protein YbaP (TraB family)